MCDLCAALPLYPSSEFAREREKNQRDGRMNEEETEEGRRRPSSTTFSFSTSPQPPPQRPFTLLAPTHGVTRNRLPTLLLSDYPRRRGVSSGTSVLPRRGSSTASRERVQVSTTPFFSCSLSEPQISSSLISCSPALVRRSSYGSASRWEWLQTLWTELASNGNSFAEQDRLLAVALGQARVTRNVVAGEEGNQREMM